MNALVPINTNGHEFRQSTDAAGLCGAIVQQTAKDIQGRRFVSCEGWQAIAIAHGCVAGARDVERVEGGVRAIGEVRRMSDGHVLATAEGFVGEDEPVWFGGVMRKWKWGQQRGEKVWYEENVPKRADYAIRAMAQTRAISRACRSAFAHVVVMIDAGLSTTPAEEVPDGGFVDAQYTEVREAAQPQAGAKTQQDKAAPVGNGPVNAAQLSKLKLMLDAIKLTETEWLRKFGAPKDAQLHQLPESQFRKAVDDLEDRLAHLARQQSNGAAQNGENFNIDDEVKF